MIRRGLGDREAPKFLPAVDVPAAPGSRSRILEVKDGKIIWEGKEIQPGDPIPELED